MLDPQGDDRQQFIRWVLRDVFDNPIDKALSKMDEISADYSAAAFPSLRSQLRSAETHSIEQVLEIVTAHIPPATGLTRRYQTLQALINCTRRSLLLDPNFTPADRNRWEQEIRELQRLGIR